MANMQDLIVELDSQGYSKVKTQTRSTLLVYVPKAERMIAMEDIATKLRGGISKDPLLMRKISSLGGIVFPKGSKFEDFNIGIKPDQSKSLTTDEQETLAGMFIITKLNNPDTTYSQDDLKEQQTSVKSGFSIDSLYEKAGKAWILSSTTIAETLYPMIKGKKFNVHQRSGSKFEANISEAAKRLIKESGHMIGLDKWNPADIWLVHPRHENTDFKKYRSIKELNTWLMDMFKKKEVIGVSLKQAGKTAKVQTFNEKRGLEKNIRYKSFDVGKTGFLNTINGTIYYEDGISTNPSFVIRSFGRPVSVNVEVDGKLAKGGKVGSGPLFNIIKRFDQSFRTMTHQEIINQFNRNPQKIYAMLYERARKLEPTTTSKYKTLDTFAQQVANRDNEITYVISKLQVCDILLSVKKMSTERRNKLMGAVISYALSSTEISSVFVKVS